MHAQLGGPTLPRNALPRDTSMAAVLRDLNARALQVARIGGPVSMVAYAVGFLITGRVAFLAAAGAALALGLISHRRLKAGDHNAEYLFAASSLIVVLMWPVAEGVTRGALMAALILLAMQGYLILPRTARYRTVALVVMIMIAQLFLLAGDAGWQLATTHVGLSLAYLALGLLGTGLVRSALERSERDRIEVFRRVPVGLTTISRTGELLEANPAFAEMLGYTSEELVGRKVASLYDDPGQLMQLANRLSVESRPIRYAHRLVTRDGSVIWVRGYTQAVRDDTGAICYYEGAVEDVTQRRELEEQSRVHAERFRNVFERAPIAIWEENWTGVAERLNELREQGVTDLRQYLHDNPEAFMSVYERVRILDVNPAGLALVGADTKEQAFANGRPDPPPSLIASSFIEEFNAVWENQDHITVDAHGRDVNDDPLTLAISWGASRDARGALDLSHVIVTMADISTLKRAERELAALVESKDELVASVSHELRTPITTIMGMAFELRDHADRFGPGEADELIGLIADQSRELSNIVEDLLVAARSDLETLAVRPEALDVHDEIAQIVASTAPGPHPVIHAEGAPTAWADPLRFRQIVRNLLSNARRYGGSTVRIDAGTEGGQVVVRVSDDGAGVPIGDEEAIFQPYTRSTRDDALPGSIGLGLPVSRRLARLMGGDLTYRYDRGSIFEVRLPTPEHDTANV